MLGWFPVCQTILYLEERDNEMRKTARGHGKPHKRGIRKTPVSFRKPVVSDDEFLESDAGRVFRYSEDDGEMEHWLWFGDPTNPIL